MNDRFQIFQVLAGFNWSLSDDDTRPQNGEAAENSSESENEMSEKVRGGSRGLGNSFTTFNWNH